MDILEIRNMIEDLDDDGRYLASEHDRRLDVEILRGMHMAAYRLARTIGHKIIEVEGT